GEGGGGGGGGGGGVRVRERGERGGAGGADPRRGQVHQRRGAKAASADDQDLGVLEPPLTGLANVRDDQVPGVAPDLIHAQVVSWGNERRQRHGKSPGLWRAGLVITRSRLNQRFPCGIPLP